MENVRVAAQSFQDLIVWQKAHTFVLEIYKETKGFPKDELFGLVSQLRRAAVSIPANIAEGFKKISKADKARFLNISQGSLEECRYYLILAHDLNIMNKSKLWILSEEICRLLTSYRTAILDSKP